MPIIIKGTEHPEERVGSGFEPTPLAPTPILAEQIETLLPCPFCGAAAWTYADSAVFIGQFWRRRVAGGM